MKVEKFHSIVQTMPYFSVVESELIANDKLRHIMLSNCFPSLNGITMRDFISLLYYNDPTEESKSCAISPSIVQSVVELTN